MKIRWNKLLKLNEYCLSVPGSFNSNSNLHRIAIGSNKKSWEFHMEKVEYMDINHLSRCRKCHQLGDIFFANFYAKWRKVEVYNICDVWTCVPFPYVPGLSSMIKSLKNCQYRYFGDIFYRYKFLPEYNYFNRLKFKSKA